MIELKGKCNSAKVFTDNVDSETISQVMELLNQSFVSGLNIRIMPDCHAGKGCVIGTTMTLQDKIVPNLTGVDLGCGMYAVKLEEREINLEKLDNTIQMYIPNGFNIHAAPIARFDIDEMIAPVNKDKALCSIGSLGGGNHFIEMNRDKDGALWLVVHTGSRHLGVEVCNFYQDAAIRTIQGRKNERKNLINKLKSEGREIEIQAALQSMDSENKIPKHLCYLEGEMFNNYIHDVHIAQEFAKLNRKTIIELIINIMGLHVVDSFDTIHNYIDTESMILRKGSISARRGEKVLIPMNMRDGSLVCIGKGNPDWNYSAPHGAGRILSRSQAKERIDFEEFKKSMNGIYSTSVVESTMDEAPMVYKPMDEIIENIKDTVDVVDIIKPIYNFKSH